MTFDVAAALMNQNNDASKAKKRYSLLLFNTKSALDADVRTIERAINMALPDHVLLRMEDPDEALKLIIIKNVELIIMDTSFLTEEKMCVEYALEAKKRKKCPVFFIARDEQKLIAEYRKQMYLYEELDDYLLSPLDALEMARRLKRLETTKSRAAKRFAADAQVRCFRLDSDTPHHGSLRDLSLVGFSLSLDDNEVFRRNEQVQIRINLAGFNMFHGYYGDYLRLSGKVRRVSIDGKKIGCSIEHITPMQLECLTQILEKLARRQRRAKMEEKKQQAIEDAQNNEEAS